MKIEDLTIGQAKELASIFSQSGASLNHPYKIGEIYLIRTVTMTLCGKLKWVGDKELVLEFASWIADTGRFSDALKDVNVLEEVEPFPEGDVIVGRGAIVDAVIPAWKCSHLPKVKK